MIIIKFLDNNEDKISKIERLMNEYYSIKNSSDISNLQEFVSVINSFNDICTENVSFVADKKTGKIYVEVRNDNSFVMTSFIINFNSIIAYELEESKLLLYFIYNNEISAKEYNNDGKIKLIILT